MAEDIQPKINKIARSLGITLINSGRNFARMGYDLKPIMASATTIKSFLMNLLGLGNNGVSTSDEKYALISWEFWQWLKDLDLIDQLQYYSDTFDCDNFAFAFSAEATSCFRLNTAGVAYGTIFNNATGNQIGRHAFNIIVTQETGGIRAYCYEPMSDDWAEIKKGIPIVLKNGWRYSPDWILLF